MRVGVTGGGGFIGRALVAELMRRGREVVVLDERPVDCTHQVLGRASSPIHSPIFAGCERLYHLEWSGSFRKATEDPFGTQVKNLGTVSRILDLGIPVVFTSTSLVYGGNLDHPADETEDVAPRAPYGEQKLEAEGLVRKAGGCAVRVFNIYGEGSTDTAQIIPRLVAAARGDRQVRLNGDGLQQRDFVHVSDAASALADVLNHDSTGGLLNLSSGVGTTMLDLMGLVFSAAGVEPEVTWNPAVAGEARMICGDPSELKALTGWEPSIQLAQGVRALVQDPQ